MKTEKERKLTPAELRRKERFEALKAELEQDGCKARELTIGVVKANVLAIVVMLPFVVLLFVWYVWVNGAPGGNLSLPDLLLVLVLFIVLAVLHELIHGLVWGLSAPGGFKSIEFGVVWSALAPYCTCGEPMKKWQYILGSVMPTVVLGFGFGAIAVWVGQDMLLYLSLLMILGGGGDFCVILKLLRHKSRGGAIYCDHPYKLGLVAFERPARG